VAATAEAAIAVGSAVVAAVTAGEAVIVAAVEIAGRSGKRSKLDVPRPPMRHAVYQGQLT
jgi:hypothetical protein